MAAEPAEGQITKMDQQRIKELIDLLADSDLSEMTLSEGGTTLTLTRRPASGAEVLAAPVVAAFAPQPSAVPTSTVQPPVSAQEVRSPLYGILHLTPSPEEAPFVVIGDSIEQGQTLCVVEAMKMFHQVKAIQAGRLEAILAAAGDEVQSGQALFRIV